MCTVEVFQLLLKVEATLCVTLISNFVIISDLAVCMVFTAYRGTIPDNLKKYIHGEPSVFEDKKQLLALGSRSFIL